MAKKQRDLSPEAQGIDEDYEAMIADLTPGKPYPANCPSCNRSITPRPTGNGREFECPGCGHRWTEEE